MTHQRSPLKDWLFRLTPLVCLLLIGESLAFIHYWRRHDLSGDRAFHPLFHTHYRTLDAGREEFRYDPFLGYRYIPGRTYVGLKIGEQGFITNGTTPPDLSHKPPGVTRIFLLGGSIAAGNGASSNTHTISAYLERVLNHERDGAYQVINAAVSGFTAYQETAYFIDTVARYRPDVVIFYDGWNDLYHAAFAGGYLSEEQKECCWADSQIYALYLASQVPASLERPVLDLSALLTRSYLTQYLVETATRLGWTASPRELASVFRLPGKIVLSPEEAAERYDYFSRLALGAVAAQGVRAIRIVQPVLYFKQPSAREADLARPLSGDLVERFYQRVAAVNPGITRGLGNRHLIQSLDLSHEMWKDVDETVYVDHCHTNDRGNELVARRLAELVRRSPTGAGR